MDLMALPYSFQKNLVKCISNLDVVSQVRFSRTCRQFSEMTKRLADSHKGLDFILDGSNCDPMLIRDHEALSGTENLLPARFSNAPIFQYLPKNSRMILSGYFHGPDEIFTREIQQQLQFNNRNSTKFSHAEIEDGTKITPELVRFLNSHVEWVICPSTHLETMFAFPMSKMRSRFQEPEDNEKIEPFIELLISEWKAGRREIKYIDVNIQKGPDDPFANVDRDPAEENKWEIEHVRDDGMKIVHSCSWGTHHTLYIPGPPMSEEERRLAAERAMIYMFGGRLEE